MLACRGYKEYEVISKEGVVQSRCLADLPVQRVHHNEEEDKKAQGCFLWGIERKLDHLLFRLVEENAAVTIV